MEKHPDHSASFDYPKERYLVKIGNSIIVDTTDAIRVNEDSPRASYYNLLVDGHTSENAVWYYPQPLEYVKEISNHLSFYSDIVEIVTVP